MQAEELLTTIHSIIAEEQQWQSQVRYNWVREFGKNLVMLMNPEYAVEFLKLAEPEFRLPKGIIAINQLLNDNDMLACRKIEGIKAILAAKGYDGIKEHKSWKRTETTHGIYCRLAVQIREYENQCLQEQGVYTPAAACS
ncbi:hypothetical protein DIZ81_05205 [Legionella taurinensis]|uniref:Uncharacterized protein n=1 Tax=Legionella taurinensis TaxID=70611 RepID=A0A3A5LEL5_9GAMM|nr:hypothetical protein [Legionella taurinensis]MDX1837312.1 hypothetical protein [Legionella taurinensis]PUT40668.1 hypothetical protein DB744_05205 [Legionella taurinensis]PUT44090.1 hypothetical protein DB746_03605 [Legionella taurinensis]PUT47391.1 hypothetical protein DB743_01775 [Legionella taurinensis]PUT48530.1 hypothetical protein DB745_03605 [Legionella taurinensis]